MKKFLIINPFGIGDVLFTTPVIRSLKAAFPGSFIGYWCNIRVKDILTSNPRIDRVYAFSRGDLKKIFRESTIKGFKQFFNLFRQIKNEHFDISLDFSLDHRYSLILKCAGIKKRIGFNYKNRGRFLTEKIKINGYSRQHMVEYYLQLLKPLQIPAVETSEELFVDEDKAEQVKVLLLENGINENDLLIAIAPGAGASWGEEAVLKHWNAENFASLANRLIAEYNAKIVLLGDSSEIPIAERITGTMKQKPLNLIGRTDLKRLAAVMNRANLLITNDGGPLHIAVALGKKTVSIFGPVDERVYGPYPPSRDHIVISRDLSCRPCYEDFRLPACTNNRKCIEDITVDEVYAAIRSLAVLGINLAHKPEAAPN